MDREAWRAVVHGVPKSQTRLSDWTELNWTELNDQWCRTSFYVHICLVIRQLFCMVPYYQFLPVICVVLLVDWHSGNCLVSSVQSLSRVQLFVTPWTAACQASLSITNSQSLPKLMSKSVMPSNHLILCHPLLLLPSIFPSIRVFSKESVLHIRWPKYWSFRFSITTSNEFSGLIPLGFLAVQGTLKSLFQHHSSKASIICCSAYFTVKLTSTHE